MGSAPKSGQLVQGIRPLLYDGLAMGRIVQLDRVVYCRLRSGGVHWIRAHVQLSAIGLVLKGTYTKVLGVTLKLITTTKPRVLGPIRAALTAFMALLDRIWWDRSICGRGRVGAVGVLGNGLARRKSPKLN